MRVFPLGRQSLAAGLGTLASRLHQFFDVLPGPAVHSGIVSKPAARQSRTLGAIVGLVLVLTASRVLLAPKYLFYFDSINFALALEDFNPALHQPQPPGYPLFVLFTRALRLVTPSDQWTFVTAGVLASLAATAFVWIVGRDLFGTRIGTRAALLLLFQPAFWFGAVTNQVRIFLAAGSAALMIAAWRSMQEDDPHWFYIAAAVLGIAAGFRPEVVAFGMPLLLYCGWRQKRQFREWVIATAVLALTVGSWLTVAIAESGGPLAYMHLLKEYSQTQFGPTSMAFGSQTHAATRMFLMAIIWYGLPVLTWLWITPFANGAATKLRGKVAFLTIAVVPAFAFHALIHVGDPDHTLFAVPAIVVVGGVVLASLKRIGATIVAVLLNVVLFFAPPRGIARACSYATIRNIDAVTQNTISEIERLRGSGTVVLITYDYTLTWRQLGYHFRDTPIVVLQHDPRYKAKNASAWLLNAGNPSGQTLTSEILLPKADKVVWLLSRGRGMHRHLEQTVRLRSVGTLPYTNVRSGFRLEYGAYIFKSSLDDRVHQ